MADYSPLPQSFLPTLTDNGTVMSITLTDFDVIASGSSLTAPEIDASTGDIRKFLFAFCEKIWSKWAALTTATKPTKFTLTKSTSTDAATSVMTQVYTFTFKTSATAQDVVAE
jgi:hypothetical protein